MLPATHNIPSIYNGDTLNAVQIQLQSSINNVSQAVNLTGVLLEWSFYKNSFEGPEILKLSTATGGLTIINATGGTFQRNQLNWHYNPGQFVHKLKLTFPGSIEKTYLTGTFLVTGPR